MFKIGDRVKCIKGNEYLKTGEIYTVVDLDFEGHPIVNGRTPTVLSDGCKVGDWASQFELVKEEKSKFKVGDKVKVAFHKNSQSAGTHLGKIGTITSLGNWKHDELGNYYLLDFETEQGGKGIWDDELELIQEALMKHELVENMTDELELLDIANRGIMARNQLVKLVGDRLRWIPMRGTASAQAAYKDTNVKPCEHVFKLKEKPKLEPYPIGSWSVSLDGANLRIGCEKFNMVQFRDMLQSLIIQNRHAVENIDGTFTATKTGIKFESHFLKWSDAEILFMKLKDL